VSLLLQEVPRYESLNIIFFQIEVGRDDDDEGGSGIRTRTSIRGGWIVCKLKVTFELTTLLQLEGMNPSRAKMHLLSHRIVFPYFIDIA